MAIEPTTAVRDVSALDAPTRALLVLAETLRVMGYFEVRVSAPGERSPQKIIGSVKDHVPGLTARLAGHAIIADALFYGDAELADVVSRMQLFTSACGALPRGELHILVPYGKTDAVKALFKGARLRPPNKVWEL